MTNDENNNEQTIPKSVEYLLIAILVLVALVGLYLFLEPLLTAWWLRG